jgi:hypothetical protein
MEPKVTVVWAAAPIEKVVIDLSAADAKELRIHLGRTVQSKAMVALWNRLVDAEGKLV